MKSFFNSFKETVIETINKIKIKPKPHKKAVQPVVKIKPSDIDGINKAMEYERGLLRGDLASEQLEKEKLKRTVSRKKKENISKVLNEQQNKLYWSRYREAFSWRSFFKNLEKKKVFFRVNSYNFMKKFGVFEDLLILKDGSWAIVIRDKEGNTRPIISGRTTKDLFRNYGSLTKTVATRNFIINLNEDSHHVENILEREIPSKVYDGNGKEHVSRINSKEISKVLLEKDETIQSLMEEAQTSEEAYVNENMRSRKKDMISKVDKLRAENAEGDLKKTLQEVADIRSSYDDVNMALSKANYGKKLYEEYNKKVETAIDKAFDKLAKKLPKDAVEEAKGLVQDDLIFASNAILKNKAPPQVVIEKETKTESNQPQVLNKRPISIMKK